MTPYIFGELRQEIIQNKEKILGILRGWGGRGGEGGRGREWERGRGGRRVEDREIGRGVERLVKEICVGKEGEEGKKSGGGGGREEEDVRKFELISFVGEDRTHLVGFKGQIDENGRGLNENDLLMIVRSTPLPSSSSSSSSSFSDKPVVFLCLVKKIEKREGKLSFFVRLNLSSPPRPNLAPAPLPSSPPAHPPPEHFTPTSPLPFHRAVGGNLFPSPWYLSSRSLSYFNSLLSIGLFFK